MTGEHEIDLALGVLDHQIVDCEGRRCGKVDDLELESTDDGAPVVVALHVGAEALRARGAIGALAARLARRRAVRVAWSDVAGVDSALRLRRRAAEHGLDTGDRRAARWVARLPGSRL